ncbi:MAG TPA: hypothetical protein VGD76_05625, partial [Ramlibacter sp.]
MVLWLASTLAAAQVAGAPVADMFTVVQDGRAQSTVFIAADAGAVEKDAAADLVKYVERMTGARLPLQVVPAGARAPSGPAILVGKVALAEDASLA